MLPLEWEHGFLFFGVSEKNKNREHGVPNGITNHLKIDTWAPWGRIFVILAGFESRRIAGGFWDRPGMQPNLS